MANLLAMMTSTGVYLSNMEGDSRLISGTGTPAVGCIMSDAQKPTVWIYDSTGRLVRNVDIYSFSTIPSRTVSGAVLARSVQADAMRGDVYALQPYDSTATPPIDPSSLVSKLIRSNQSTLVQGEVAVKLRRENETMFFAMDMKTDRARRRIWFADTGNDRVLEINLDTLKFAAIYDDQMASPSTLVVDPLSGNAFVRTYDRDDGREVICRLGNSSVLARYWVNADFSWSVNGSVDWLNPDVEEIITSHLAIPFPHSGSMAFDHMRGNLWWVSGSGMRILYMLNVNSMIGTSMDLSSRLSVLSGVDVDLVSGDAFVCGWTSGLTGKVLRVDSTCFGIPETVFILAGKIYQCEVLQGNHELLPFSWYGVDAAARDVESTSSESDVEESVTSTSSDDESDGLENGRLVLPEPEYHDVLPDGADTFVNWVDTYLWTYDESGISSAKVGTVPGMPNESPFTPTSAIPLPRFSWSAVPYDRRSVFLTASPDGHIGKAEYDPKSGILSVTGGAGKPVGGDVRGLSVTPTSGEAYVSGGGVLAKIQIDSAGSDTGSSSSSSGSESGETGDMPYELSERIATNDISVQWHEVDGTVWCLSKSRGTLIRITDFHDISGSKEEYGVFDAPFRAVWSGQHSAIIVFGSRMIYSFDPITEVVTPSYGFTEHKVVDGCVSPLGQTLVVAQSDSGNRNVVRVVAKDFFSVAYDGLFADVVPYKAAFISEGKIVMAAETIGGGSTIFYLIDLASGIATPQTGSVSGLVSSLFSDRVTGCVFAVMADGKVFLVCQLPAGSLSDLGYQVSMAGGGLMRTVASDARQTKIRVYVGSKEGLNDMWDSGEVSTSKTSMLYGGGNNLVGGQEYWVHVCLYHKGLGWSPPQIKEFIVPRV
jgi:hypothetical protein